MTFLSNFFCIILLSFFSFLPFDFIMKAMETTNGTLMHIKNCTIQCTTNEQYISTCIMRFVFIYICIRVYDSFRHLCAHQIKLHRTFDCYWLIIANTAFESDVLLCCVIETMGKYITENVETWQSARAEKKEFFLCFVLFFISIKHSYMYVSS